MVVSGELSIVELAWRMLLARWNNHGVYNGVKAADGVGVYRRTSMPRNPGLEGYAAAMENGGAESRRLVLCDSELLDGPAGGA
jgi:hypothetical protein